MSSCRDAIASISQTVEILAQQVAQSQPNALAIKQLTGIINNQLSILQAQVDTQEIEIQSLQTQMGLIMPSGILAIGIHSLNGVANPGMDIELVAGSGITILNDPVTKRITFSAP